MVNATQMAKVFNKNVKDFIRNENTKTFIAECLKRENSPFLNIKNESDLIDSKQKSGTWMHRILALKFAAWLNPAFELWVYSTIDTLIMGHYKKMEEAQIEKLRLEKELKKQKEALVKENPKLAEIFATELKIKQLDSIRKKEMNNRLKQLKLEM
jgi:hypothetical protein